MAFVYLNGTFELIRSRLETRKDHFMPMDLLKSQFDTLEPPSNEISVSIDKSPDSIVKDILKQLN